MPDFRIKELEHGLEAALAGRASLLKPPSFKSSDDRSQRLWRFRDSPAFRIDLLNRAEWRCRAASCQSQMNRPIGVTAESGLIFDGSQEGGEIPRWSDNQAAPAGVHGPAQQRVEPHGPTRLGINTGETHGQFQGHQSQEKRGQCKDEPFHLNRHCSSTLCPGFARPCPNHRGLVLDLDLLESNRPFSLCHNGFHEGAGDIQIVPEEIRGRAVKKTTSGNDPSLLWCQSLRGLPEVSYGFARKDGPDRDPFMPSRVWLRPEIGYQ